MLFRSFILSVLIFVAVACFLLSAKATDLPKESTCHVKEQVTGKQVFDKLSAAVDGILSWDETYEATTVDCGQTQWPPMRGHCYGFAELDGKFAVLTGYCVYTDQDGDKIVWKLAQSKYPQYSSTVSGSYDVLMASGKYKGISGKQTWNCVYGGSFPEYVGECNSERTFKFP